MKGNKKLMFSLLSTAFVSMLFAGAANAQVLSEEGTQVKVTPVVAKQEFQSVTEIMQQNFPSTEKMGDKVVLATPVETKTVSTSTAINEYSYSQLSTTKEGSSDPLEGEGKKTGIVPDTLETVSQLEDTTGINPIYFPEADLSKVVQEWKVVGEQLLRKESKLDSEVTHIIPDGTKIQVVEKLDDQWYKIKFKETVEVEMEGKKREETKEYEGFISPEYIQLLDNETKQEVVDKQTNEVNEVKEKLTASIKEEIKKEEEQRRIEEEKKRKEEEERQRVEREKELEAQRKAEVERKQAVSSGGGVLSVANKYLGADYLYGAPTTITSAFDCSSFTKRVFSEMGISLPRTSASQASVGVPVSRGDLQAGDLVFFNTSGSGISHVAIYAGNGKFVGSQSSTGVAYASMSNSYWSSKYVTARRVR